MARSKASASRVPKSLRKGPLPRPAADVWLAGLGALATSLGTGRSRFDALLAEGRRVQAAGGRAVREAISAAEQAEAAATAAVIAAAKAEPAPDDAPPIGGPIGALSARVAALGGALAEVTVAQDEAGWTVAAGGRRLHLCPTRRAAVTLGRREARAAAPSRLVVRRADGTAAETVEYGAVASVR
ncbi:MAG TPA: phasin family protein [Rubricoccaceae bacterium]|jgi:hypothetical protein